MTTTTTIRTRLIALAVALAGLLLFGAVRIAGAAQDTGAGDAVTEAVLTIVRIIVAIVTGHLGS